MAPHYRKSQLQSNTIKAQQCNNCEVIAEKNKIHISVSVSQMPTQGANRYHAANPFRFYREITMDLWAESSLSQREDRVR